MSELGFSYPKSGNLARVSGPARDTVSRGNLFRTVKMPLEFTKKDAAGTDFVVSSEKENLTAE